MGSEAGDVCLSESLDTLPELNVARIHSSELAQMPVAAIYAKIVEAIEAEAKS